MNYKTFILGIALVLTAMLVLPAMACPPPPTCPPGEVWGQTGQDCHQVFVPPVYGSCNLCPSHQECTQSHQECDHVPYWQANGFNNQGACVSDCQAHGGHSCQQKCSATVDTNCHTVCDHYSTIYDCHVSGYVSCDGQHHEKQIITPGHFEEQCDPIFGCIAVSCPAIPCPEGQDCVDAQCLPHTCPRIPCESGYTCQENQCVPDGTCPVTPCNEGYSCIEGSCYINCEEPLTACLNQYCADLQTDAANCGECGNDCGPGFRCRDARCQRIDTFTPYTSAACQAIVHNLRPMDDIDPATLPLLDLKNTFISASFKYASRFDCVYLAYYTRGEPSYNAHCTAVEYYNREQAEVHSYGGMPILTAMNPAKAICVGAVKNSPGEATLPVTITLTDSHGTYVPPIVSSDPVIQRCYRLPEVFSECRLRDGFTLLSHW